MCDIIISAAPSPLLCHFCRTFCEPSSSPFRVKYVLNDPCNRAFGENGFSGLQLLIVLLLLHNCAIDIWNYHTLVFSQKLQMCFLRIGYIRKMNQKTS